MPKITNPPPPMKDEGSYVTPADNEYIRATRFEVDNASQYIDVAAGELTFTDGVSGTVALSALGGGAGDMTKAVYDAGDDGLIDNDAGGTNWDSSGSTGLAYISAGSWGTKTLGITNAYIPPVDMVGVADDDYAKFTANGLEGRSYAEVRTDLNVADGADVTGSNAPQAHASSHAVSAADTIFPADPNADRFLMWDDDGGGGGGALVWQSVAGGGDMLKATYDAGDDGFIDAAAGGTNLDTSGSTGFPYITAGVWSAIAKGIANGNVATVDQADAASGEYARMTANGIESRSSAESKSDLGYLTDLSDDASPSLGGELEVGENGVTLDPSLSADGKYSGITIDGTAGAALAFGDLCYLSAVDTRWELAQANAASTSGGLLGICVLAAAGDGSATTMLLYGHVRADTAFPNLTVGAKVYVSAATAGDVTTTAPAGTTNFVVRIIGHGTFSVNEMLFNPDGDYIELA